MWSSMPLRFGLEPIGAIFAQQQLQQFLQVLLRDLLAVEGPLVLFLRQQRDDGSELGLGEAVLGLLVGLLEQCCAARIGGGFEIGHLEDQVFQAAVLFGHLVLFVRERVRWQPVGR